MWWYSYAELILVLQGVFMGRMCMLFNYYYQNRDFKDTIFSETFILIQKVIIVKNNEPKIE